MGANRPNWYYDHPPACTCANCNSLRLNRKSTGQKIKLWLKRIAWPFGRRGK